MLILSLQDHKLRLFIVLLHFPLQLHTYIELGHESQCNRANTARDIQIFTAVLHVDPNCIANVFENLHLHSKQHKFICIATII